MQKPVISAGSDRLRKKAAVSLRRSRGLAGCSLLSVQLTTSAPEQHLSFSVRHNLSYNQISAVNTAFCLPRFPQTSAKCCKYIEVTGETAVTLEAALEEISSPGVFCSAATSKMLAELVCISKTKSFMQARGHELKKSVCAGLKRQLQITARAHRTTENQENKYQ